MPILIKKCGEAWIRKTPTYPISHSTRAALEKHNSLEPHENLQLDLFQVCTSRKAKSKRSVCYTCMYSLGNAIFFN